MKARFTLLTFAGLLVQGTAFAQASSAERPWYVGLTQDFTHDSNVLGTTTGDISDTVSTTSLNAGLNQIFGRQRLRANASLRHQRYQDLSERDNNGYTVGLTLDWSTIERLSGDLSLSSQRRQTDFSVGGITPVSLSNIERSDDLNFRVRLGVVTMLALEAGVGHRRVEFSAPEYAARQYKQDNVNLGVVYRPSGILTLRTGVSAADTRYAEPEVGQTEADRSKRRDVYVGASWVPTGASSIDGRLSFGKQEHDLATAADFEGMTGSLTWAWRPTGRLALTTSLVRDSGLEAGFLRAGDTETSATDFSQVTNRLSLTAAYELTGKVGLAASLAHARRKLVGGISGTGARDNTTLASLAARWEATRTINFECRVSRESRSSSGAGSSDFDSDSFGCSGSITLD